MGRLRFRNRWLSARPVDAEGVPGTVLSADAAGIVVAARAGALAVTSLKRAGGKALAARDFLNGCPVERGGQLRG